MEPSTNLNFLHYGSLEKDALKISTGDINDEISLGIKSGNINITLGDSYSFDASKPSDNQKAILAEFERRKRARQLHLTTDDNEVKLYLRKLRKPICLFGEGPGERRERLKQLLSALPDEIVTRLKESLHATDSSATLLKESDINEKETWYHEGPTSLKASRMWIARYSLPKAKLRLKQAKLELGYSETQKTARKQEIHKKINSFNLLFTQIGDQRPLSFCDLSSDGSMVAISSWSGLCKIWRTSDCKLLRTLNAHSINASCIRFKPNVQYQDLNESLLGSNIKDTNSMDVENENKNTYPDYSEEIFHLASSSNDGSVKLWSLNRDEQICELKGHEPYRVSRLQFHPSARFLATCCFDNSWRLWDLETREEILFQEGHSDAVFDVAFQSDGSLAATGSLDTFGRVWDLRTGHCIMFMEDHLKPIYTIDWHPNGYQLLTGSQDNTVKIWDVRMRKCLYTIPAHQNLISKAKFLKPAGECIMTASYDGSVKIWTHPGWMPIKTLQAQEGKIMGADIYDFNLLVTCGFDKTFKLWGPDPNPILI